MILTRQRVAGDEIGPFNMRCILVVDEGERGSVKMRECLNDDRMRSKWRSTCKRPPLLAQTSAAAFQRTHQNLRPRAFATQRCEPTFNTAFGARPFDIAYRREQEAKSMPRLQILQ